MKSVIYVPEKKWLRRVPLVIAIVLLLAGLAAGLLWAFNGEKGEPEPTPTPSVEQPTPAPTKPSEPEVYPEEEAGRQLIEQWPDPGTPEEDKVSKWFLAQGSAEDRQAIIDAVCMLGPEGVAPLFAEEVVGSLGVAPATATAWAEQFTGWIYKNECDV